MLLEAAEGVDDEAIMLLVSLLFLSDDLHAAEQQVGILVSQRSQRHVVEESHDLPNQLVAVMVVRFCKVCQYRK